MMSIPPHRRKSSGPLLEPFNFSKRENSTLWVMSHLTHLLSDNSEDNILVYKISPFFFLVLREVKRSSGFNSF